MLLAGSPNTYGYRVSLPANVQRFGAPPAIRTIPNPQRPHQPQQIVSHRRELASDAICLVRLAVEAAACGRKFQWYVFQPRTVTTNTLLHSAHSTSNFIFPSGPVTSILTGGLAG